jgi:trans-aconitate 2-methyltransferase
MPPETCQWEGSSYDRISAPQQEWGAEVIERLGLDGDETVIDAGCGSGRVTELLIARLPRGRAIAVDGSPSMVAAARERLAGRAEVLHSDLLELEVQEPVDAILSTATFHWIGDHPRLFARLRAALRPGGRLAAQCGGRGNIEDLRTACADLTREQPYAAHFDGWEVPWNYADPRETEERLAAAGFGRTRCWLADAPVRLEDPREFLRTIVIAPYIQRLPEGLGERFLDEAIERIAEDDGAVVLRYVRLNIDAVA